MAPRTARMAIIARLVVGPDEPHVRIVEPRLLQVEDRDRDAQPGAGAAARLLEIGAPGLLEPLDRAGRIGEADLGKLRADIAPAALEHAEHVTRRGHLPGRQGIERSKRAARLLLGRQRPRRIAGRDDLRRLAVAGIGLAENVILIGDDAVVICRSAPQHRAGRHQRPLGGLDHLQMAGAARLARDAIVARVDEADEFGRLAVEQGITALRIGRRGIMPRLGKTRQDMRPLARGDIIGVVEPARGIAAHRGIAAVAIDAAQHHRRRRVHRRFVGSGVAAVTPVRFGGDLRRGLAHRGGRRSDIDARHRLLAAGRVQHRDRQRQRGKDEQQEGEKAVHQ